MTTADFIVRAAEATDVDEICDLFERELLRNPNRDLISSALANFPSAVALSDQKLFGFCYLGDFAPDIFEVYNIVVDPDCQSRGAGSAMLAKIATDAKAAGANGLILCNSAGYGETAQGFRFAEKFYRRNGFQLVGETPMTKLFYKDLHDDA